VPADFLRYFPHLTESQRQKFTELKSIYDNWNRMINVISRKDMDQFYVHHVLHSLAIGKVITFNKGTTILDVGTGGGFPGIPLAIMFPDSEFSLLDSIGKKIKVVTAVKDELKLENVIPLNKRVEEEKGRFHFIVSRAVTSFPEFVKIVRKNIHPGSENDLLNGILYLKGGDLKDELSTFENKVKVWEISRFFEEPFFETKKIVYIPA
jgi:16S rRNA (guanine527-N7)-methyltransferase